MGKVINIFVSPDKGLAMSSVEKVNAVANTGLEGDRYSVGKGAWSKDKRLTIRDVSFIDIDAFNTANSQLETPFTLPETRRNIVTEGINLNDLVGKQFAVGSVLMFGVELCDPCSRPSQLAMKPSFKEAFYLKGGLRAKILTNGLIEIGQEITAVL